MSGAQITLTGITMFLGINWWVHRQDITWFFTDLRMIQKLQGSIYLAMIMIAFGYAMLLGNGLHRFFLRWG